MQTLVEMLIFIGYSLLAPVITAGGSMVVTNALTFLTEQDLVSSAGITSAFFCVNAFIALVIFRKGIVWYDVRHMFIPVVLGAFLGAYILVHIEPLVLLVAMLLFSLNFIYKKVTTQTIGIQNDSLIKQWAVGLFSSAITATALPGGGFMNAYFASKGYTLSQMYGTLSLILVMVFVIKVAILLDAGVLQLADLRAIGYSIPFLIVTNICVRSGILSLSKKVSDWITILAMCVLSGYLLYSIIVLIF